MQSDVLEQMIITCLAGMIAHNNYRQYQCLKFLLIPHLLRYAPDWKAHFKSEEFYKSQEDKNHSCIWTTTADAEPRLCQDAVKLKGDILVLG